MKNSVKRMFAVLALLVCVGAIQSVAHAQQGVGTNNEPVLMDESYFGMHVHSKGDFGRAFSDTPFSVFRTWDSAAVWPLIEPEDDKWDWELLDKFVGLARENGETVLFTLGMTPFWAAREPDAPSPYGTCSSSPPRDIEDWKDFIRTIAERNENEYGGAIRYWEVWNEPDNIHAGYEFYTGTVEELVEMGRVAAQILKEVNQDNVIVGPGITQAGGDWLALFLEKGGCEYVDVIGFHFYWDWFSPGIPDFRTATRTVQDVMERTGCANKPLWLTETGVAMANYPEQNERRAALVSMLAAPGYYSVERVFTYSWNNGMFTTMFDTRENEVTDLFTVYNEVYKWLLGARVTAIRTSKGVRLIELERGGEKARIAWKPDGRVKFEIDFEADTVFFPDGQRKKVPDGGVIPLDGNPVLIGNASFIVE